MTNPPQSDEISASQPIIKPSAYVVSRIIGEQALILDTNRDEIRQLNEVGTFIWSQILKSTCNRDDLLQAIVKTFDTTLSSAESDLEEFLSELSSAQLIQFV
jgi:hypothetical protein